MATLYMVGFLVFLWAFGYSAIVIDIRENKPGFIPVVCILIAISGLYLSLDLRAKEVEAGKENFIKTSCPTFVGHVSSGVGAWRCKDVFIHTGGIFPGAPGI